MIRGFVYFRCFYSECSVLTHRLKLTGGIDCPSKQWPCNNATLPHQKNLLGTACQIIISRSESAAQETQLMTRCLPARWAWEHFLQARGKVPDQSDTECHIVVKLESRAKQKRCEVFIAQARWRGHCLPGTERALLTKACESICKKRRASVQKWNRLWQRHLVYICF